MFPHILYNNRVVNSDEPIWRPGQLGLLSGWGVFTTLRVYEGVPFAYERHWRRMSRDAKLLHIDLRQDPEQVLDNLRKLIAVNQAPEAGIRLCVFRSRGGLWEGPGSGNDSDLIAMMKGLERWKESVSLGVTEHGRHAASPFAGTKTLSWAHNLTFVENAAQQGFGETILLNERGEVAECTSANIFAVIDGITYTPPLSSGPLPGITRAVMLEELDPGETPVRERVLSLDDLYGAQEVFITSSTRELLAVHQIGDRRTFEGEPGARPVMEKLRQALRAYVRQYVAEAAQLLESRA